MEHPHANPPARASTASTAARRRRARRGRVRSSRQQGRGQQLPSLLQAVLTPDEYEFLRQHRYLEVPSRVMPDRSYRIQQDDGRVYLREQGRPVALLCVQPTQYLPPSDVVVMHKLLIETDEDRYLATANHFPLALGIGGEEDLRRALQRLIQLPW